jgi:hypothetical protein
MSGMKDWNTWNKSVIAEFRASEGRAGGDLEGMPMVLVHHLGRKSGQEYVNPLAYLPNENDDSIYISASKGGAHSPGLVPQPRRGRRGHHRGGIQHLPGHRQRAHRG